MEKQNDVFKKITSHAKEYGFVFPSSEIYDGLSAVYDYGHVGTLLRNNLKEYWMRSMVQLNQNIVPLDSAIFMHPTIWKASGHVDAFNDPMIDNKDSKKRYRADVLVEDYCAKIEEKIEKEVGKAKERFGDRFDEEQFRATNERVLKYQTSINQSLSRLNKSLQNEDLQDVKNLIEELQIADPESGSRNWTDVKQFNLMFGTQMGSDASNHLYLRPETAQGIFVNFLNVQKTARLKLPFGIAQIGKAFRNEIVARQFIFRMREFEQMEMQFFIAPGTQKEWFAKWKENRIKWHHNLGFDKSFYRFHDHEKLAHYADAATDIEFKFPFGFKELEGIHSRTDFDLSQHEKFSGKKLRYFDPETQESFVPFVLETSIGLDRLFLSVLTAGYREDLLEDGSTRVVLGIPKELSPLKAAILPLVKKDGLPEKASEIYNELRLDFQVMYEDKDAIGRRYRRQDAIGTPFCITVDHQTLEDQRVTIRERDSMAQQRIEISKIKEILQKETSLTNLLKKL